MLETMPDRLTARTKAGGCASKLSPKIVDQVLARIPRQTNDNVLVGFDTADDAGVYRLTPDCALVQTVDFFTPIVDDPWTFGAIAAANALSDVYAMGGKPLSSLTILCWPAHGDINELEAILQGGAAVMKEAGCVILGGHSINDEEVKFGYAVTGTISPDRILTNAGARPGDALLFTKRIGTGVITTALKRGTAREEHVAAAVEQMRTLNNAACEAMLRFDTHGCTDVTGFGLLGHAREMALASGVTLEIEHAAIPLLPGAIDYARAGCISGGLVNNREFVSSCVEGDVSDPLLFDPQTSGGLLIAIAENDAAAFARACPPAVRIGRVLAKGVKPLRLV
jgi:selenide, water dikinase